MNMNPANMTVSIEHLKALKSDAQKMQKKGLPFMMASVIIWTLILLVQFSGKAVVTKNLYTFMCSCFLMPLAFLFSKIIGADIFRKTQNPINKLGLLCTMNQMLYLLIVMWAYSRKPEAMLMLYAMVFAGHLLPYGWVYDSKTYTVFSVAETIGALAVSLILGNVATAVFMIAMQCAVCILLFAEVRKEQKE
ncbi:MAG: hypothetical protein K6E50_09175 [Lachnospiraceae bacterium]|nr:hypothetical protein [Lachnospiraceae bacterium]